MDASEAHLEQALVECNDTVSRLESDGPSHELLEAYVNRAGILAMLEYRTSALDDTESAIDLGDELSAMGSEPDAGTMFKIFSTRAILMYELDNDPIEEYACAAAYMNNMDEYSNHYEHRSFISTCITAVSDLLDYGHPEETYPFRDRMSRVALQYNDSWTLNRRLEMANLEGETFEDMESLDSAIKAYAEAVRIGSELLSRGSLEDEEELISSMLAKARWEQSLSRFDDALVSLESACLIMEQLDSTHHLEDVAPLSEAYSDIANILSSMGRDSDAESYLIKAMRANMRQQED